MKKALITTIEVVRFAKGQDLKNLVPEKEYEAGM